MSQMLLFPDPRPLVERLGPDFFRRLPETPGVYLMRDGTETVLYVGKAKNLRKRLSSYRVANPDRMRRRHLRLLRAVERIELQPCSDEAAALARESALLRTLRPKFNRAGTWPGTPRFLAWRITGHGLELAVPPKPESNWCTYGPMGITAVHLRAALARLIWGATYSERGAAGLPEGWFAGRQGEICTIPCTNGARMHLDKAAECLRNYFTGQTGCFPEWILSCTASWTHPFDLTVRDADLETLSQFAERTFNAPVSMAALHLKFRSTTVLHL
jgi:predicted GIY-YIG superfamily endonuclease